MNPIINTRDAIKTNYKPGFKKINDLIGQPLGAIILKNMLCRENLKHHPELYRSIILSNVTELPNKKIQVIVEFENIVPVVARFNYERQDGDNLIDYHVYATVQSGTDGSTELVHKYVTSSLSDAYSFANDLLDQQKYLPKEMWGKDVFCE